jgi:hypothetical protein
MEETIQSVKQHILFINDVMHKETKLRSEDKNYLRLGTWREDTTLKTMMADFKSQSEILSHTCVKFALLINPKVDLKSKIVTSILDEFNNNVQMLLNIFR